MGSRSAGPSSRYGASRSLRSRVGSVAEVAGPSPTPAPKVGGAPPAAVPSAPSAGGVDADEELVLRIREVPVDSRRGRVSLAIGSILLEQAEMLISWVPGMPAGPPARPPRGSGFDSSDLTSIHGQGGGHLRGLRPKQAEQAVGLALQTGRGAVVFDDPVGASTLLLDGLLRTFAGREGLVGPAPRLRHAPQPFGPGRVDAGDPVAEVVPARLQQHRGVQHDAGPAALAG